MTPDSAVDVKPHLASAISRDGRWAAVVLPFANDDEMGRHFRVYVKDLDESGRRDWRRLGGAGFELHSPSFSPDNRRISVLRDSGENTHVAIFELAKLNGPYRVVSDIPDATLAYKWLEGPDEVCCLGTDTEGVRRVWVWRGAKPTPLTPADRTIVDYTTFQRLIAYVYRDQDEDVLVLCSAEGKELRRIEGTGAKGRLCFSSNGRQLAFVHVNATECEGTEQIAVLDLENPVAVPVSLGGALAGVITSFDWHIEGHLLAAYAEGTRGKLVELRVGQEPVMVENKLRYLSAPSCDQSRGRWMHLEQDNDVAQRLVLVEPDGMAKPITFFNDDLGPTASGETVEWQSEDGERVEGIWIAPPGEGPHPTIVWLHGGPAEHIGHTFSAYFQVLVGAGYAVFAPNYRGSSGRGPGFSNAARGHLGELDAADVLTGIASLVKRGLMHPTKFGIWGWHYGATLGLLLVSRDQLPAKALVAGAPFVDWLGAFGAVTDPSPMEAYFAEKWWLERASFDAVSPVTYVKSLQTPILLLQGQQDLLIPLSQSMLLYRALKRQGTPTDLIYYVNEGHVLRGASAVRDMLARALVWFEDYLGASDG